MSENDLLERLRTRDWRMTPQRRTIAEVLVLAQEDGSGHLTAEQIHELARARLPEVSLTTVYNTLHELVGMGEVCEIRSLGGSARYDADVSDHHHLRCVDCGDLVDVHPEGLDGLRVPEDERRGHTILGVDVIFQARCPACG